MQVCMLLALTGVADLPDCTGVSTASTMLGAGLGVCANVVTGDSVGWADAGAVVANFAALAGIVAGGAVTAVDL